MPSDHLIMQGGHEIIPLDVVSRLFSIGGNYTQSGLSMGDDSQKSHYFATSVVRRDYLGAGSWV